MEWYKQKTFKDRLLFHVKHEQIRSEQRRERKKKNVTTCAAATHSSSSSLATKPAVFGPSTVEGLTFSSPLLPVISQESDLDTSLSNGMRVRGLLTRWPTLRSHAYVGGGWIACRNRSCRSPGRAPETGTASSTILEHKHQQLIYPSRMLSSRVADPRFLVRTCGYKSSSPWQERCRKPEQPVELPPECGRQQ